MARVKIQLQDGIKRVIFVETDATIGADIGLDLRYQGQVQSLAQLRALFGGGGSSAAVRAGYNIALSGSDPTTISVSRTANFDWTGLHTFTRPDGVMLKMTNVTSTTPASFEFDSAGNVDGGNLTFAMWESDLGSLANNLGFRWYMRGDLPGDASLSLFRHRGSGNIDEVVRFTRAGPGVDIFEQARFTVGNATAPSLALTGATSTGLYFPTTGSLAFSSFGTTRVTLGQFGEIGLDGALFGSAGQAMRSSGTGVAPTWGTLGVVGGGTSFSTYTTGDILYSSAANVLAKRAIGSAGDVLTVSGGLPVWAPAGGGGGTGANPTALVGLTAVNGVATTFLRSDGAPALSQAIAPTWTGTHLFTGATGTVGAGSGVTIGQTSGRPILRLIADGATTDQKTVQWFSEPDGSQTYLQFNNDAQTVGRALVRWSRTGNALTGAFYGNTADLPDHLFYGRTFVGGAFTPTVNTQATRLSLTHSAGVLCEMYDSGSSYAGFLLGTNGTQNIANILAQAGGGTPYLQIATGPATAYISLLTQSAERVRISAAGALRFNTYGAGVLNTDASGNITAVSDERAKDNIRPFTRGLTEVLALRPILHGYNEASGLDQTRKDYAGFSAQNVERAIPEAVGRDSRDFLTFNDRPVLAAVVNAMQEMYARLVALENRP